MIANNIGTSASQQQLFSQTRTSIAASLGPAERKKFSLRVFSKNRTGYTLGSRLPGQQKIPLPTGCQSPALLLDRTFSPSPKDKDVIFYLPITKDRIRQKLECKMERARKRGEGQSLSKKPACARQAAEYQAVGLAEDARTLVDWMHNDILSLSGPGLLELPGFERFSRN